MSDPQTIWRLGVALVCAGGAWWMKVAGSGVQHVSETNRLPHVSHDGGRGARVHRHPSMDGSNRITDGTAQRTAPASNVIMVDFAHRRAVNDLRRRLDSLGVAHRLSDPVVKR